ncbi:MAG TPA: serine/threonine-protein kinase [Kofleriaceae bacterium]|nr:serine/threonine-protein kinase [Kofleriaceae bacterium]
MQDDRETLASSPADRSTGHPSLPRGTTLHRYVVLDEVGAGAMGVVYAAYDASLDRKVAVKLVRDPDRPAAHARLLREAHALAQLSHPNVVAVFDVGTHGDQVFVAMEFVAGTTLRSWLMGTRGWREVLAVFRRAGEGLAAAHSAGIVHRDFKPDNLLIDGDGRVRVGDFGLALIERDRNPVSDAPVRFAAASGTLAYMAPEQQTGRGPTDARADQFSFCVSLHEALCGERPFGAEDAPDLVERIAAGAIRPPPRGRVVPAWLRKIIRRGLADDPDARYPSMDALLADIDRATRARRRLTFAGLSGLSLLAAGAIFAFGFRAEEPVKCRSAAARLNGVWDGERRQAIQTGFRAAGPAGSRSLARVEPALDRYAKRWVAMHTESCEATHVRGEQPEAMLDLRTQCLERRLADLRALTDLFRSADAGTIKAAAAAVESLDPLELCANQAALRAVVPPPDADVRARAEVVRTRLASVRALATTGKYRPALEQVAPLVAEALEIGYRPIEAEALQALGRIQRMNDRPAEAEETLYRAIAAGEAGRSGHATVEAWLDLLNVVGTEQMRFDEARRLAQVARGAIQRLGGNARQEAKFEDWLGQMYTREGKAEEARAPLERAIALFTRAYGEEHQLTASALRHLGDAEQLLGKNEVALGLYRRSRAIVEKVYGPDHPRAVSLLGAEGATLFYMNRHREALAIFERGLAAEEKAVGSDTHTAATYHRFIGLASWHLKDNARARRSLERAVAGMEKLFGRDHAYVAPQLSTLGEFLNETGRRSEALVALRRALAIQERTMGADHPDCAVSLDRIALVHIDSGEPRRAIALLERSLRIRMARKGDPRNPAVTRYQLAQALHRSGQQRKRVRPLLRAALSGFETAGDAETAAEVKRWLAAPGLKEPRAPKRKGKRR